MSDWFKQMVNAVAASGETEDLDPCSEPGEVLAEEPPPESDDCREDAALADTQPAPADDVLAAFDAIPEAPAREAQAAAPEPEPSVQQPLAPTTRKASHSWLKLQGVCSECAHCGQPLTDSVSIERGIGPICSKKGYLEDEPKNPDEMQALIELAEFPELVEFLTEHYKPKGVRGLMNGLVKVCSLNRRTRVHTVCTNAIEALGYERLAATLRESIAAAELKALGNGTFEIWVKKQYYKHGWFFDVQKIGATKRYGVKGLILKMYEDADSKVSTIVTHRGRKMPARVALWTILNEHFSGLFIKTPKGAIRIKPATFTPGDAR